MKEFVVAYIDFKIQATLYLESTLYIGIGYQIEHQKYYEVQK